MFKVISLREDGSQIEVANEVPAFYALVLNRNILVGYFITIQAAWEAANDLMVYEMCDNNVTVMDLSEAV